MTPADLMAISPARLAALSDAELGELLAPLLPAARAHFIGKGDAFIKTADGKKIGRSQIDQSVAQLTALLANGGKVPTNKGRPVRPGNEPLMD